MPKFNTHCTCIPTASYLDATGPIPYNMTNDYLFRALLQQCKGALKSLVCALLHLDPSEIIDIRISNPIVMGESMVNKEFILDTNVLLNNHTIINLEMQVINTHNWTDRSLSYLCRSYDQLHHGQEYTETLPAIHIGFLDFRLFDDHEEFYSTYQMLNVKDHYLFSDKLTLGVVDLTCIDLATKEDKAYRLDDWARLFKATTWEEIKMIAEDNKTMQEASQTLYELLADKAVQDKCRAREDYQRTIRTYERDRKRKEELELRLEEIDKPLDQKNLALEEREQALLQKEQNLIEKDTALAEKDNALAEKDNALAEKDSALAEKDNALAKQAAELTHLKTLLTENNIPY